MYTTSVYTQTAHMCAHTALCTHTTHMSTPSHVYATCTHMYTHCTHVCTPHSANKLGIHLTSICNVHRIHVHTAHTGTHCTHMYTTSHVCVQTTHTCAHTTPCTRTYTRVQTSHMCAHTVHMQTSHMRAHTVHMHVHTLTPIPPRSLNAAFLAHKLSRPLCVPLDLMGVWSLSLSLPLKEAGCPRALTVTPTWSCIRWAWGPPASARWNPRLWDRPWHPA